MATITYNGVELPPQLRKVFISRTERELEFSSVHMVASEDFKQFQEDFAVNDRSLVIESGAYSETFLLNDDDGGNATPVTGIEAIVERLAERTDGENGFLVRFMVRAKFQAISGDGIVDYNISWTMNDQGIYVLSISGEMTGIGSATALESFETNITPLQEFAKELLGDLSDGNLDNTFFDEPSDFIQLNSDNGHLRFTRTFNELPDPANEFNGAEVRDETIVFPTWEVSRVKPLRRGKDEPYIVPYTVSWTARLQKDKTGFINQYDTTIRALLVKRIKELFSESDTLILEDDEIRYARTGQTATGVWRVTSNAILVSYSEKLKANVVLADSDKVLDSKDFTEAPFSPGARLTLTQTVVHVQRGTAPGVPPAPVVSFGGVQLQCYLKEFSPEEETEFVGGDSGSGVNSTGSTTEHTLNWVAVYQAYAKPEAKEHETVVSGGKQMNIQGKIIHPTGSTGGSGTSSPTTVSGGNPVGPSGSGPGTI